VRCMNSPLRLLWHGWSGLSRADAGSAALGHAADRGADGSELAMTGGGALAFALPVKAELG